ncbi:hypothetical protein CF67_03028 [Candidatus Photodesmus blepharus]|uniref:Uncharacterized protein n=2 Tax=Candidatus Photodesmus blepharonis TaxID=1179155 RepID=A0A084CN68_9GAMM|nr:hypothetical protein CF67_03028 [Candidatus Photodesmus blepharus]
MTGLQFSTFLTENSHIVSRVDTCFNSEWDVAVGIGFNGPVDQLVDVYGQFLIHYLNSIGRTIQTEINIGGRMWITEKIEVTGRIGRNDDRSVFHSGIRFHSTQQLSISAEVRNNGLYGPQATMSVRFHF